MLKVDVKSNMNSDFFKTEADRIGKKLINEVGKSIYDISQTRCAVDSGTLKASGYIKEKTKEVEVGYACKYALYVEVMPQAILSGTGHGGKAHFLSGSIPIALKGGVKLG